MSDRSVQVRLKADISDFQRGMLAAGSSAQGLASRLEAADGRMANLVQSGLALAPALSPIGAAAVPAIAGLTLQLGLAAGAAGVAVLAFNGVGTALKALNTYQAEPTTKNLEKLDEAMDKLGPSGQEFVLALDKLSPKLAHLRNIAEGGLLPDVTESLDTLITLTPQASSVIGTMAKTLGELSTEGADALTGTDWTDFFSYIERTAGPVLLELGQTLGNVTEGLANMLQAFDPVSRDFSTGLLEMSRDFKNWSQSFSDTEGFNKFIDYIQKSGPQVLDTVGHISMALVDLFTAAAPIGTASLKGLDVLAETLSAIADSPVGPVLIGIAAAVGTLGRALAILKTVGLAGGGQKGFLGKAFDVDAIKGVVPALSAAKVATAELAAAEREARTAHAGYIGSLKGQNDAVGAGMRTPSTKGAEASANALVAANQRQAKAAGAVAEAEGKKSAAIRSGLSTAGKAAGVAAGLAVATSGLADKSGFANTASLALMGTIAGPWGAAIGGGVGLVMDFAHGNTAVATAIEASNRAAKSTDLNTMIASYQKLNDVTTKQRGDEGSFTTAAFTSTGLKNTVRNLTGWTSDADKAADATEAAGLKIGNLKTTLTDVRGAVTGTHEPWVSYKEGTIGAAEQSAKLQATLNLTAQAFAAAGKSSVDARAFLHGGKIGAGYAEGIKIVKDYKNSLGSVDAASKSVGAAMSLLAEKTDGAVDAATALKSAMDELFGGAMDVQAATDAWAAGLQTLEATMKKNGAALTGNSKAALENRAAVRDQVSALEERVNAEAKAGASGAKLTQMLVKGRQAIIDSAKAGGASGKDIVGDLDKLHLNDKSMSIIITAPGVLKVRQQVEALTELYHKTPKQITTLIAEAGANPTGAKIRALAKQYDLTPKQVKTILSVVDNATRKAAVAATQARKFARLYSAVLDAKDNASGKAKAAQAAADAAAKKYWLDIAARDNASGVLHRISGLMGGLQSKTVTFTTIHRDVRVGGGSGVSANPTHNEDGGFYRGSLRAFADGGFGSDGRYYDREPQIVAGGANILWGEKPTGWEAYISGKPGQEDRNRDVWRAAGEGLGMNWQEYMDGGLLRTYANGGGKGGGKKPTKAEEKRHQAVKDFNLDAGQTWREVRSEFREFAKATGGMTKQLHHLEKAAEGVAKKYNQQQKALEDAKNKRDSLRTAAEDSFNGSLYGNGVAGLNLQLQADTNDATAFTAALDKLKGLGISKDFAESLSQSGDLNTAQQLAGMSASQIAQENKLYGSREAAQANLGQTAVDIAGYTATIKDLNTTIKKLGHQIEHLEDRVERGARSGSHSGTKAGTEGKNKEINQRRRTG